MNSSVKPLSLLNQLKYYITPAHDCSYLDHTSAQMVFLDPEQPVNRPMLSQLSRYGFRRSGDLVYRPECQSCHECYSCRVPVQQFQPNSQQKKTLKRNQDLHYQMQPVHALSDLHYQLYEKYIHLRHADGEMYPPNPEQFEKFLKQSCADSHFLEIWLDQHLICVSVFDIFDDGLSAVYTFFDPDYAKRSLGVYAVLALIEQTRQRNLPFVYLGYWVPNSDKMNYKIQFQPLQVFLHEHWFNISDTPFLAEKKTTSARLIPSTMIE